MREKFGRWNILLGIYFRRDWKRMLIWIFGLGLFASGFVSTFKEIASDDGVIAMYETLQNPAMIFLIGTTPILKASEYSLGAMYAHELLLFCSLFSMTISMLHVINHSRKDEDLGNIELVRSFHVGRQANSLALLSETIITNILLSLFIAGIMMSTNAVSISVEGSILYGISIGLAGIMGASIALVMAQIMPTSSSATSASLGIMGLLYIIRGATDISRLNLSIFNPLGWSYLTYPFTENNWLFIIWGIIFAFILTMIAFYLEGNRDIGSGFISQREGKTHATASLLSIPGLFLRLNRNQIIYWHLSFLILSATYGTIYGDMERFLQSNELMKQMFTQTGITIEASFTNTIMLVMAGLVTILPIALVNRLFLEEKSHRLNQIFATKVSRGKLYWTHIILAISMGLIGILISATALGVTALSTMKNSSINMFDFINIGINLLPSLLFFTALAALMLGFIPKLGKLVYVYLIYSIFLNYFKGILNLPQWVEKTSPQSWLSNMPVMEFDVIAFLAMTTMSVAMMVIGYYGYTKRDMVEEA